MIGDNIPFQIPVENLLSSAGLASDIPTNKH